LTFIGLVLIAFGSGGIKPCVAAFGGEQFTLPQQAKQLGIFFSLFYFAINLGSFISTSVTPILREDIHCFGQQDCFPLGFGLPAVLMAVSVVIFLAGKFLYKIVPPQGNMFVKVCKCIGVSHNLVVPETSRILPVGMTLQNFNFFTPRLELLNLKKNQ
jgi:solute carrier family 15 (oligopeptide transporter), member 1